MKPASVLALTFLLAPFSLPAQNLKPDTCPVSLHAQHRSDGDFVKTKDAHPKGIGQALHLTISNSSHGPVKQAVVVLHGLTPKGRVSPAAPDSQTIMRRQSLQFQTGEDQSTADLWVSGFSAITSVEISSIAFSDGTSWIASANSACSFKPDLVMWVQP